MTADCAAALLGVVPEFALPQLKAWLADADDARRETAALVLAQSKRREAVELLVEWTAENPWDKDFALGVRALGFCRDERAREYLLAQVAEASAPRARLAAEALRVHEYDEALQRRLSEAIAKNRALGQARR